MTTVTVTSTAYSASVTGGSSVTVTSTPQAIEIRGGIVGPAPADLSTASTVSKSANDILAWNTTRGQYEPARITADNLLFTFLADLAYVDGQLTFDFPEAGGLGMVVGFL